MLTLSLLESKLKAPHIRDDQFDVDYHYIRDNDDLKYATEYLMTKSAQNFDTETTGLDPMKERIILAQIGDETRQFLIDPRYCDLNTLNPFLTSQDIKKVAHNALFDYCMVGSNLGIQMEAIRCTFLAETVLTIGAQYGGRSLYAVVKKYLEIELDKKMQTSFIGHQGDFSKEQLGYAAMDARDPIKVLQRQSRQIKDQGLAATYVLECDSLPAFGDMRLCGMKLDKELWEKTIAENIQKKADARERMDDMAEPYWGKNLFGEIDINYDSQQQVLQLLQMMGVKVKEFDKKENKWVERVISNTNKQTQKKILHLPFIKALGDYRKYGKLISTYGENFYPCINERTGRIHPELKQIGTETGRPSAGEEDNSDDLFTSKSDKKQKKKEVPNINPLNIPARAEYRHAFICDEDYIVETDDYSGCEMRILAEISGDPNLTNIFMTNADAHCYVASELYGVEVTKNNEHGRLRKPAKALNFGIAYGMGPFKLFEDLNAEGFDISLDETKEKYNKYCNEIFPVAVKYLRDQGVLASQQGYLINLNGRRRYWNLPDANNLERFPKGRFDGLYKGIIAKIQREGGNFLIQSVNADMTKLAMTMIRRYAIDNGIRTKIYNSVYDEIVTETHKDDHAEFWPIKQRLMREAAEVWLKKVPMVVDGDALPYWTKG